MSSLCFCNSSEDDDFVCLCYDSEEEPDEEENVDDNTDEDEAGIGGERVGIDDVPCSVALSCSSTVITGNSANSKTNKENNGNGEIGNCDNGSKDCKNTDLGDGDLLDTNLGHYKNTSISLENVHQNPSTSSKVQNLNEQTSNVLANDSTSDPLNGCSTPNKKQAHLNEAMASTHPSCSTEYEWQFQETDGSWVSYDNINTTEGLKLTSRIHSTVSQDFNRYCSSRVTPLPMAFWKNNHRCLLDLQSMTEHDQDEGTERPIRRVLQMANRNRVRRKRDDLRRMELVLSPATETNKVCGVQLRFALPSYWSPMQDDTPLITEPLNTFSAEYKKLVLLIKESHPTMEVIQITRIQNIEHYQAYEKRKTSWNLKFPEVPVKEEFLFHGTKSQNVESICDKNFNVKLSGTANGHAHGRGVYFTNEASMAATYATRTRLVPWRSYPPGAAAAARGPLLRIPLRRRGAALLSSTGRTSSTAAPSYTTVPSSTVLSPSNALPPPSASNSATASLPPTASPPLTASPPSSTVPPSSSAGPFPNPSTNVIFIVKVLMGRYILGCSDSQNPSDDKCGLPLDTTVDNQSDPRVFVKYNSEEYYPEYFVEFKSFWTL